MDIKTWLIGVPIYLGLSLFSWALSPHEVALIVNESSQDSMELANHYCNIRKIPPQNVFYLSDISDVEKLVQVQPTTARYKNNDLRYPLKKSG